MLKACWDCMAISTANREQEGNEEAYGIRLNGDTQRAPPWPKPHLLNEKMFILPRKLQFGDKIHITGQTSRNRQKLTVNLLTDANGSPDYQNIACQLETRFVEDKIDLRVVTNGMEETSNDDFDRPSQLFDDSSLDFTFTMRYSSQGGSLEIDVGASYLGKIDLRHDVENIRFLTIHGDIDKIDKLEFEFA